MMLWSLEDDAVQDILQNDEDARDHFLHGWASRRVKRFADILSQLSRPPSALGGEGGPASSPPDQRLQRGLLREAVRMLQSLLARVRPIHSLACMHALMLRLNFNIC